MLGMARHWRDTCQRLDGEKVGPIPDRPAMGNPTRSTQARSTPGPRQPAQSRAWPAGPSLARRAVTDGFPTRSQGTAQRGSLAHHTSISPACDGGVMLAAPVTAALPCAGVGVMAASLRVVFGGLV